MIWLDCHRVFTFLTGPGCVLRYFLDLIQRLDGLMGILKKPLASLRGNLLIARHRVSYLKPCLGNGMVARHKRLD